MLERCRSAQGVVGDVRRGEEGHVERFLRWKSRGKEGEMER